MRLVFPGQNHANVALAAGEYRLGTAKECEIRVDDAGWLPHQASLSVDAQRGVWLCVEAGSGVMHVNARPVRECAMLRPGDLVTIGKAQFCLMLDQEPVAPAQLPARRSAQAEDGAKAAAARVVLRGITGPSHGHTFPLTRDLLIGSAADADIRIDHDGVAPRHSHLELHGERIVLRADAPGNRLKLNGVLVENAVLHPGDQLALDPYRFVIEAPGLPTREGMQQRQQRPITQTMPAVSVGAAPPAAVQEEPRHAGSGLVWLLLAACGIALILAGILLYAPR